MFLVYKLALRNLLRNPKRTFLTVFLIACSAAALIFTDGFMQGMGQNMVKSATRLFPGDGQIHHPKYLNTLDSKYGFELGTTLTVLAEQPDIQTVTARTISSGMVSSSANVLAVQVIGIMPKLESQVSKISQSIIAGEYFKSADNFNGEESSAGKSILVGHGLAKKLEAKLGDRVVLSLPKIDDGDISQELFRISGIFKFNSKMMDEGFIFVPLNVAQTLMGKPGFVQEVAFNFTDASLAQKENHPVWQLFNKQSMLAQSWAQLIPELASMLTMTDFSLLIIGVILFIIASLGVVNAMFMSIYERIWELGVLKAIGTRSFSIFRMIMIEGVLIAIFSALLGTALGLGLNYYVGINGIDYSQMEFSGVSLVEPVKTIIRPYQYLDIPFFVVCLTLLSTCYPAWFASRIVPSRALHKSL
jgi:ABC-type lipoprotein release transport system permease subunit